jgi:hypothetical protein
MLANYFQAMAYRTDSLGYVINHVITIIIIIIIIREKKRGGGQQASKQ